MEQEKRQGKITAQNSTQAINQIPQKRVNFNLLPKNILGLYCKIIYGDPDTGGDPIREWETQEKIGDWEAVSKKLLVDYLLSKLKVPVPNLGNYDYTTRYTTWHLLKVYIDYW